MSQFDDIKIGSKLRVISIDMTKITYRDWLEAREPKAGDIAEIMTIFDVSKSTVQLNCEPKKGFPIWRINISLNDLKYEILDND